MQGLHPKVIWTWEGVVKGGVQVLTHDLDQPTSLLINNDGIDSIYLRVDTTDATGSCLREIKAGEEVVTSAQFLIDSESKLHEATAKMTEPSAPPQKSEPNPLLREQGAHPHD